MKILVIGSGGREHAITWKLKQSQRVSEIFVAPGNAGIGEIATLVNIKAEAIDELLDFAKGHEIDLTIVGPEVPLVLGIVDLFNEAGLQIFGPDKAGALFEGSKAYSKAFMEKHQIPTANYREFTSLEAAQESVAIFGFPLVIKADGLAAGKGVVICENEQEALKTINEMMSDKCFGDAGSKIVFEEFLTGIEASVLCFVDGKTIQPMASAQDYKKAFDHDLGLNTGGMGAYSPNRLFDSALDGHVKEKILLPFLKGCQEEGINYKGIIFIGLMIKDQEAKVIEFNCRMGDPETQVVLPRMKNDLLDVIEACIEGNLSSIELQWDSEHVVSVVLASGGYPSHYEKAYEINGLDKTDHLVFHAGTLKSGHKIITNGGRVLNITAKAKTLEEAISKAYSDVDKVEFKDMMYRRDIGSPQ